MFDLSFPGGSLESTLKLVGLLFFSYALVLWLSAIVWVFRDVRHRTTDQASQLIAVVLVALFNLPGLVVYLVIRPQDTVDPYERTLEAEAYMHELQLAASACQACHRPIEDDFNVCPHCRATLREPCRACNRSIRTSWNACPYCATDRLPPRPAERPALRPRQSAAAEPAAAQQTPLEPPIRSRPVGEPASQAAPTRPPLTRGS